MGCAIRTGTHFTLNLPKLFWKLLVNQEIEFEDLEEIDSTLYNLVKFMEECNRSLFEESIFEHYVTMLSDKTVVELKPNGSKIVV